MEQQTSTTHAESRFEGKVAFITGAAGDFGSVCARRFLREGGSAALVDIVADKLDALAKKLNEEFPGRALSLPTDVTSEESVAEAVRKTEEAFGKLHFCFNNAGYQGDFVRIQDYSHEDFKKVQDINLYGVFNVTQACARSMIKHKVPGSIVHTASNAQVGPPNMPAYGASKGGVITLTRSASKDLSPEHKIRVNSVSPFYIGPGYMWTRLCEENAKIGPPFFPSTPEGVDEMQRSTPLLRRIGTCEEVASVVLFLFSDDSSYVNGVDIKIDGGASNYPSAW